MQKKLIKVFFSTGVPFGVFMGIIYSLSTGIYPGALLGLLAGIFFGGLITGIHGYWHSKSVKQKASGDSEEDYNVKQSKEVEIPVSYDKAYELCIKSLDKLKKPKITTKDYYEGIITAKTGITWDTWGDTVSFKLTKTTNSTTNIIVSSEPTHYQVVDYGKNLGNVNNIISFLEEQKAGRGQNMFCKNCGDQIDEKAFVCPKCGVKTKDEPTQVSSGDYTVALGIVSIVGGTIIPLIAWIFGGIGLYQAYNKSNQAGKTLNLIGLIVGTIMFFYHLMMWS